ncbi:MAG: hypothetical protein ACOX8E_11450 [Ruminococcus sp.]|jgi:hypothetical protein
MKLSNIFRFIWIITGAVLLIGIFAVGENDILTICVRVYSYSTIVIAIATFILDMLKKETVKETV